MEADMRNICEKVDETRQDVVDMRKDLKEFIEAADAKYDRRYVPAARFAPVEKIVYGLAGATLLSVLYLVLTNAGARW